MLLGNGGHPGGEEDHGVHRESEVRRRSGRAQTHRSGARAGLAAGGPLRRPKGVTHELHSLSNYRPQAVVIEADIVVVINVTLHQDGLSRGAGRAKDISRYVFIPVAPSGSCAVTNRLGPHLAARGDCDHSSTAASKQWS